MPVSTHGALLAGRYRVRRPLGLGGMAQVLLCEDERLGRLVAVKRLHADSPVDVERRFAREARLGAALNHPNLVSVFDTAVDDDGVLIVMEYVEGQALARALRDGPLAPRAVARMASDIGAALDHAHAHEIVHRDVKPGNVLLRVDGISKLADLGIATAVDLTRITRSGELLGTAAYMAPEQLEGRQPQPASDVYALAAVCFEALCGRRPRSGRNAFELAHQITSEPPPDLREHLPSAPAAAAAALERGMASKPTERTPSAGQLATELAEALEGSSLAGRSQPAPAPTRRLPAQQAPLHRPLPAPRPATQTPTRTPSPPAAPLRRRTAAALIPVALLVLAAAAAAVVLLSSGGDGGDAGSTGRDGGAARPKADARAEAPKAKQKASPKEGKSKAKEPAQTRSQPADTGSQAAETQPQPAAPAPVTDPARGAALNDQGFALLQRGAYAEAVPILQQAVAAWPQDSTDLRYAYALFNLGKALNRSGRADEAVPYLERRLDWNDQRATVQAELDLARRNAAAG